MIQICCYKGCGVVYGQKEPLSDTQKTHGLCPKHFEISLSEMRCELEKLVHRSKSPKILIVEDNPFFRQFLKGALHDRFPSIEILEAGDGEKAFQEIETSHPDLVFIDIRLPGENGLELTRKVRAIYPNLIIVILTGYDLPEYRKFSSQYTDHFFSKDSSTRENMFMIVRSLLP
jgi:CheY-like chemotaxis protein